MVTKIELGEISVEVVKKDIKNIHLSVYPPAGRVRISAPLRMNIEKIRVFAISKLDWIKRQQRKLQEQERETPREYIDRERHYVWGKRYLLKVAPGDETPAVELEGARMLLNTELAKKPPECLEYIVVHEMVHLLEPTHNHRFTTLMDRFMPKWRFCRAELNRLPVRREDWDF